MTDHDAEVVEPSGATVAAVLAQIRSALTAKVTWAPQERVVEINMAIVAFDELFGTGSHAVVKLPEGVAGRLEELLADEHHVIQFADKGWTIAHPLTERLDGSLFDCDVFWDGGDPGLRGRFHLESDEDEAWVLGARIEATP